MQRRPAEYAAGKKRNDPQILGYVLVNLTNVLGALECRHSCGSDTGRSPALVPVVMVERDTRLPLSPPRKGKPQVTQQNGAARIIP